MGNEAYAILVDYHWCTGCHTCEMACQMEKGLPIGQSGVKVFEMGPWQIEGDVWQLDYAPIFGSQCDACAERTGKGKLPACVHHCQARCMEYGTVEELSARMEPGTKKALYLL